MTSKVLSTPALITSTQITTSNRVAPCSDASLPLAWSGGGVHTCSTYEQLDLAYCNHGELQVARCFCGGGQLEPTPMSTSEATRVPVSTSEVISVITSTSDAMPMT